MPIGKHATTVSACLDDTVIVMLHNTPIVGFDGVTITLNSGGYRTAVTKRRMNEVAEAFKLGYVVLQKAGAWSVFLSDVGHGGVSVPFTDGMQIPMARLARHRAYLRKG